MSENTDYETLKAERDAGLALISRLVFENAALTDKAASELSNAWLLHRAVMTIQAALHCIHGTNIYEAQCWLESIADDAELVTCSLAHSLCFLASDSDTDGYSPIVYRPSFSGVSQNRYRQNLLPDGRISKYNPLPSCNEYGLSCGFAFLTLVSVSFTYRPPDNEIK